MRTMAKEPDLTKLLAPGSDDESGSGSENEFQDEILSSSESEDSDSSDAEESTEKQAEEEFPAFDSSDDEEILEKTKIKKRSGNTFAAMGLSRLVLTNIQRKGFKSPTPIQRSTIPQILDGHDIVGMARTGSGKTAAFVLPMLDRLKAHSAKAGVRAIILSPSRELAMQTLRTIKDFSRKMDLRTILLVGGDSLEDQFGMMMSNPDIVVATPGRFQHLKQEMRLNLSTVEYVVFDEADRLFEMGFAEQLNDILASLPETRQTLLFSATLPRTLVDFARAGLSNPELIRLDAEQKISDQLQMAFFAVQDQERDAALLDVLQNVIKLPGMTEEQRAYLVKRAAYDGEGPTEHREKVSSGTELPSERATIVFAPTKHHVEYLTNLLKAEGYAVSYIYGTLDQSARREQLYLFKAGKTSVMVVTDVAARGVDIPMLANVVNYNMTTAARIFIHRVGRTARAGHTGWAYTLVRQSDLAYLADLEVFLGRKISTTSRDYTGALVLGALPRADLEFHQEQLQKTLALSNDLTEMHNVAVRGEKLWLKSREAASKEGVRRARDFLLDAHQWESPHPLTMTSSGSAASGSGEATQDPEAAKNALLERFANRRVKETVFEFRKNGAGSLAEMMARRREQIAPVQEKMRKKMAAREAEREREAASTTHRDENYMSHFEPTESLQDRGYDIGGSAGFADAARSAGFSLGGEGSEFSSKQITKWDKKRGKYVNTTGDNKVKFIRGENGQKIPASLRSGRFEAWKDAKRLPASATAADLAELDNGSTRFKHRKVQAPKAADKFRDDYKKRSEKVSKALEKGIPVKGSNGVSKAGRNNAQSGGLRSSAEIQKERASKQQRWEKSNQPTKKNKKGSRSKRH